MISGICAVDGVKLIAAGDDHFIGGDDGGLAHAARQFVFAAERLEIAEPVRRGDLADDLGVGHVVVIEHVVGLRLVDFEAGHDVVHVQNKIVGVVFAAGPFVETEIALLL